MADQSEDYSSNQGSHEGKQTISTSEDLQSFHHESDEVSVVQTEIIRTVVETTTVTVTETVVTTTVEGDVVTVTETEATKVTSGDHLIDHAVTTVKNVISDEQVRHEAGEAALRASEKHASEEQSRQEAEESSRHAAEERARHEAEEAARRAAEKHAAEERARIEAEEAARRAAEERARHEAEEAARRAAEKHAAEERARIEAEEAARRAAEERARHEAEEAARRAAEKHAAEERARIEAEREADERAREEAFKAARRASFRREADEQARQRSLEAAEEQARSEALKAARRASFRREAQERSRDESDQYYHEDAAHTAHKEDHEEHEHHHDHAAHTDHHEDHEECEHHHDHAAHTAHKDDHEEHEHHHDHSDHSVVSATTHTTVTTSTVTDAVSATVDRTQIASAVGEKKANVDAELPLKYSVTFDTPNRWYENLKTYFTSTAVAETTTIACNTQYFAYLDTQGSGSSIAVLPYSSIGKNHVPVNSPAYQQPLIRAHSQLVSDFAFSPFHANILYSCAPDRLLKLWKIPEAGLTVDMSIATNSLSTKSKCALRSIAVSTVVDHLVAVRGGREISLFDMNTLKESFTTTDSNSFFQGDILSMAWSYYNDYLLTTSKDKFIRLFDPRVNPKQFSLVKDWIGHTGFRYSSVLPLEDSVSLFSVGHNAKTQEREICLWDLRAIAPGNANPVIRHVVDKKDGALYPIYDEDQKVLYLSGKGESHLHVYRRSSSSSTSELEEIVNENVLTESFHGRDVVKGIALLPKTASLLQSDRELGRLLKLSDGLIQPVIVTANQSIVDSEGMITRSAAPPALTSAQWIAGETKPPRTVIVVPAVAKTTESEQEKAGGTEKEDGGASAGNRDSVSSTTTTSTSMSKRGSALRVSQSTMKYRHIYGKEPKKELTYYGLQPDLTALDSPIIAASETYWAIPYRGGGGPVYLSRHSNVGKVLPECLTLNAHKSTVQEIAFSPFHEDLMLTGSFDCTMKLWNVRSALEGYEQALHAAQKKQSFPKVTSIAMTWSETEAQFSQHTNSIRTINFHPTVPNLFCSTSQDMTLRFFDLNTIEEISCLKVFGASTTSASEVANALITNVSFNYDGTHLLMASKDRMIRSIDPRANQIVQTIQHEKYLGRNLRVAWCARSLAEDPVVTVSAGAGGLRQIALWDPRNWEEPIAVRMIDNASGQLFPMYDEGLNVVFLAGKGDTMIRGFEISSLSAATTSTTTTATEGEAAATDGSFNYLMEKCFDYQTLGRETIAGICLLPKRIVDYRNVEVSRVFKLSNDNMTAIHFHVPRADYLKEYFHDDIYLPIRSNSESHATIADWKDGSLQNPHTIFAPVMESLKPSDMTNVSEKPESPVPSETNSKIHSYRQNIAKKEEETKQNEEKFNRLQQLAFQNAQYHKNTSGPMKIGSVVVSNPQIKKETKEHAEEQDSDEEDWK